MKAQAKWCQDAFPFVTNSSKDASMSWKREWPWRKGKCFIYGYSKVNYIPQWRTTTYLFILNIWICIVFQQHYHAVNVTSISSTLQRCSTCIILHIRVDFIFYQDLAHVSISSQGCPVKGGMAVLVNQIYSCSSCNDKYIFGHKRKILLNAKKRVSLFSTRTYLVNWQFSEVFWKATSILLLKS